MAMSNGASAQRVGAGAPPGAAPPFALRSRALGRRAPAWTITGAAGLLYAILAPPSADLAAAGYRSELFGRAGFTLWDNSWYGGHHLPAYSVLAPALGWLISPPLLEALSLTIVTALFAALIEGRFPPRATRLAALWFAIGAAIGLLAGRVPFDLGLALGLGALLAAQRERRVLAIALAAVCSLASPVAGAFLALAALAWVLGGRARWFGVLLMLAALVPIALLALAFPEGGTEPFVASAFYPTLLVVLIIAALIPAEQRMLRIGALLYAVVLIGAHAVPTAVGGNADRLGALLAGPILACALAASARGPRRLLFLLLAPFLLYWQAIAPVRDFASAASDPAVHASYYAPLLGELRALGVGYSARPARVEVVPTRDHWEARFVAPQIPIARGWERQLDRHRNWLFYEHSKPLTAARYRRWLAQQAVSYVALADAPLDYAGTSEARLLRRAHAPGSGVGVAGAGGEAPYLREVWHSRHWRLFAVLGARALAEPPAVLTQLGTDSFTLKVPRAGRYLVRVSFSGYWALSQGRGCVAEAPGGWTELQASQAGSLHVLIDFSPARVFDHGPRCR
jgi:hypothetical protein